MHASLSYYIWIWTPLRHVETCASHQSLRREQKNERKTNLVAGILRVDVMRQRLDLEHGARRFLLDLGLLALERVLLLLRLARVQRHQHEQ